MKIEQEWTYFEALELGFALDLGAMGLGADALAEQGGALRAALGQMAQLEGGAVANPDEGRMVGHYWLRDPERAPEPALREAIVAAQRQVYAFAAEAPARFDSFLLVGIGGSALGPQLVAAALGGLRGDRLRPFFIDNTDPDGIDRVLAQIAALPGGLARNLVVVISKSGGTKETRNGMLEVQAAYARAGLPFAAHAVAVTGEGSELHRAAQGWLATFPMWDWVGGRTSVLSAVGLLPAALQGVDVDGLLEGARLMDQLTRAADPANNPAALMALAWREAGRGGRRDMVILPYKDRLETLSRYLQQLVMESLGKGEDLQGRRVLEGIAVYGNKGSTDQHAYVQQLRDGLDNFFATFIEVQRDRQPGREDLEVEPGVRSGDYLLGFLLGTREALAQNGRRSMTLTVAELSGRTLGMLIALFERAVGLYASLAGINAYHQPGVEAGKKAAGKVLALQGRLLAALLDGGARSARELAGAEEVEAAYKVLEHLAQNGRLRRERPTAAHRYETRYQRL